MHKIILLFLFFTSIIYANNIGEKVRILSSSVITNEDTLIANGNVVIYSTKYYISADKAIYNKKLETFELFGDVLIIKDNKIKTKSDYAFVDMKNDNMLQNPTFLLDLDSNIWIDANEVTKTQTEFSFGSAVISSCDCVDPMWSIRFTSGYYDVDDKFIHTFNTKLYIKSIPLLYTPYFGFSTDTTRRTGLLNPTIAFSDKEGFTYFQSMYFAPQDNYDIEIMPQIKLNRGNGIYAYLRYKDSAYSSLNFKTGIFLEKDKYFKEEQLANNKHYGWNFDYERSNLFSNNKENKDALFISLSYLNDVEYITLEGPKYKTSVGNKVESKINYYFDQSSYYFGTYLRYYLDKTIDKSSNSVISNDKTLQQLPQIQAHKYTDKLLIDNLSYSIDATFTSNSRKDGLNAKITEVLLPVSLNFSLFDDYINLDLKEELYLSKTIYTNVDNKYNNATFLESRQIINISRIIVAVNFCMFLDDFFFNPWNSSLITITTVI
ncbi:MAG: LPS-assembly protein LptD [Campylobacteraceae bacterium]|nr:LPS-assembly protein LptD [Campylobacteraceae bacterium]